MTDRRGASSNDKGPVSLLRLLGASATLGARTCGISGREWQSIVGPRLSERAQPESLSDGVLSVRVPSSTWAQELSFLSHVILERLRQGGHAVSKLRFRVSAPATRPKNEPPPERVVKAPLPAALVQRLAAIDDPELRQAIAEAAALSLGRQRLRR
jgi:predicted nucleic acid-binding Zn ribbon protein